MSYFNLEYTEKFNYKNADNVGYWILYNGHDEGVKDFLIRNKEKRITICFRIIFKNELIIVFHEFPYPPFIVIMSRKQLLPVVRSALLFGLFLCNYPLNHNRRNRIDNRLK